MQYTTFSNPTNIFESLRRNPDVLSSAIGTNTNQIETADQLQAIQSIIQIWETRPGSSDARIAQISLIGLEEKTIAQIEKEDITALFNDLIGIKITDKLTQQKDLNSLESESIWLGGYNSNTQNITNNNSQTNTQAALRAYGNQLGGLLKSFGVSNGDQANTLDTFIKNRSNTIGLQKLTDNYIQLASDINELSAPTPLSSVHSGLVSSYTSVGELLWNLTRAENDESLLNRMLTYNSSSEEVAKHHVTLVTLFKAHGVSFKSHEAGSIFTFSPPAGN